MMARMPTPAGGTVWVLNTPTYDSASQTIAIVHHYRTEPLPGFGGGVDGGWKASMFSGRKKIVDTDSRCNGSGVIAVGRNSHHAPTEKCLAIKLSGRYYHYFNHMSSTFYHKPVLLKEVLETFDYLTDRKDPVFVDGTIGLAGHSLALAKQVTRHKKSLNYSRDRQDTNKFKIIGIDKDSTAIEIGKSQIANRKSQISAEFIFVHDDFKNYDKIIQNMKGPLTPSASLGTSPLEVNKVDGVLLDLGVSSMQLDDKSRGFSFQNKDQPLDMRMDKNQIKTASNILNSYSITELEQLLKRGEERRAKIIAKNAAKFRKNKKIAKVKDLLEILEKSIPLKIQKTGKTHYSTATFRALRIEVNDELKNLNQTIIDIVNSLKPKSRLAIITFHSLEDRIVKHAFKNLANPCVCPPKLPYCVCGKKPQIIIITKKPTLPSQEEIDNNPRSRSAKLRIIEKI